MLRKFYIIYMHCTQFIDKIWKYCPKVGKIVHKLSLSHVAQCHLGECFLNFEIIPCSSPFKGQVSEKGYLAWG